MPECTFCWTVWNGQLHPEVRHEDYTTMFSRKRTLATHPITEREARLPLAALVKMFPPPPVPEDVA